MREYVHVALRAMKLASDEALWFILASVCAMESQALGRDGNNKADWREGTFLRSWPTENFPLTDFRQLIFWYHNGVWREIHLMHKTIQRNLRRDHPEKVNFE